MCVFFFAVKYTLWSWIWSWAEWNTLHIHSLKIQGHSCGKVWRIQLLRLIDWIHVYDSPGPWFNIKMPSYQNRKPHCGDKTILRQSYLHYGISHTGKMASFYWTSHLVVIHYWLSRSYLSDTWYKIYVTYAIEKQNNSSSCMSQWA